MNRDDDQFQNELLSTLPLGAVRYFDRTGSTNDEAARWAADGAPDLALVIADEQTAGRGRLGRRWSTSAGTALAFSLVLRPQALLPRRQEQTTDLLPRLAGLGALAVCGGLEAAYALQPEIKWPNDVLLRRKKMAGVLVETHWQAEDMTALILGIGVNVASASVPPEGELAFPATCVERVLGGPVERWDLLRAILESLLAWRARLAEPEFLAAWEARLAFRGEVVQVNSGAGETVQGEALGLTSGGGLRLRLADGGERRFQIGELRLRPVDSPPESAKLSGEEREA